MKLNSYFCAVVCIACSIGAMAIADDVTAPATGTQYYVSQKGDDQNDGKTQDTAWKSVAKVNSTQFAPGDSILFQRGGNWHAQLIASSDGSADAPITYADYGDAGAAKPTFWGSDPIAPSAFTLISDSLYTFPVTATPIGHVYYVFADHHFLTPAKSSTDMPAESFFVDGGTVHLKTASDPRSGPTVFTASDRAQGPDGDSSLICSNGHNNLVFNNLIGKETAGAPDGGDIPDGYVFRLQNSSNIHLTHCEAYNGGKHHFGVINTTGFVGKGLKAGGCIPGMDYGHASAFVSFSDESRHGDTSQWIDCTVDDFDPAQQSFFSHGQGMGSLLLQNLTSNGCAFAVGTDGPDEKVTIKGGLLTGPSCDLYGNHIIVDGLHISGGSKIDIFGNDNIIENCVDQKSNHPEGSIVVRGKNNIIRFNTLDHAGGPSCISMQGTAADTKIIGNLFTGGIAPVGDGGASGLVLEYNGFDASSGSPTGLEHDAHLVSGDPHFTDATGGNYALGAGSAMIGKVPASITDGPNHDSLGNPRPVNGKCSIGAFEIAPTK